MRFAALRRYCELTSRVASSVAPEEQHSDYEAGLADINGEMWRIRTARVTPTKPGAFVALWRRSDSGETAPFTDDGRVAGVLVFVDDGMNFGVFRFEPSHLVQLGIFASARSKGKRGFRVYPSWCKDLNSQASKSQRDQAKAFSLLSP